MPKPVTYLRRNKKKLTWQVIIEVPKDVREEMGTRYWIRSTRCRSKPEAEREKHKKLAEFHQEVAKHRNGYNYREALQDAKDTGNETAEDVAREFIKEHAEAIEARDGEEAAQQWYEWTVGLATDVTEIAEKWLGDENHTERTRSQHRHVVGLLAERHPTVEGVDRKKAARFTREVLSNGRKADTVARQLSTLNQLWSWMENQGYSVNGQMWAKLRPKKQKADAAERRGFSDDEAREVLAAVDADKRFPADGALVRVMAVSGLRLEAVASLTWADVTFTDEGPAAWLRIAKDKTASGRRTLPIADPDVVAMLKARRERSASATGPVFAEYQPKNATGSWSAPVSKRLGRRMRAALSSTEGLAQAHSWRHRAYSKAQQAGLRLAALDKYFGHALPGEAGRYYSPEDWELLEVAKALRLPGP